MRRLTLLVALLAALAMIGSAPAQAGDPTCNGGGSGWGCGNSGHEPGPNDDPVYTDPTPGPYYVYRYIPNCGVNEPEDGGDIMCGAALTCPDDLDIRMRVYRQRVEPPNYTVGNDWDHVGVECRGPDDPAEGGPPAITEWMIYEEALARAPQSVVTVEPGVTSYVNVPNNFFVDDATQNVTITLIGIPISVSYRPLSATWNFGDGASGTGFGIRDAAVGQPGAVEHDYLRRGDYSITVTRSFEASATLPNGQVLTLTNPVTSTSTAQVLDVGEIQSIVTETR